MKSRDKKQGFEESTHELKGQIESLRIGSRNDDGRGGPRAMSIDGRHAAMSLLLVEDNPADVRLMQEALRTSRAKYRLFVVNDGEDAMLFLRRGDNYADMPVPDVILLDLNLPRKDGRAVLSEVKHDEKLKHIPIVVLTTSESIDDIARCYKDHANCYLTKPLSLDKFDEIVRLIETFWFMTVQLPRMA